MLRMADVQLRFVLWQVLEQVVGSVCPEAEQIAARSLPGGEYRAWSVPSLFGQDKLECVLCCLVCT